MNEQNLPNDRPGPAPVTANENKHKPVPGSVSLKKLAANRRNALKSTGPKTPRGRAVSKMNALQHGILSREVLVRGLNLHENSRELDALSERFWQELKPAGPVEEMLVDQIVTTHWRLRRALRAESGEIVLSVDQGQWARGRPQMELRWTLWESFADPIASMEESVWGIHLLEKFLDDVQSAVEKTGGLTEAAIQEFVQHFHKPNRLTRGLQELRLKLRENPEGLQAAALQERNNKKALAYLNKELAMLGWLKAACQKREANEEQARQAAAVLPAPEVLDKILRYETKLERQMFRAMIQLERLQRMRHGEAVPPPITMEVSDRP